MFVEKSVKEFTRELATGSPFPGGGSASALAGALSASLVSMVCNLTLGREKFKEHEESLGMVLEEAGSLRRELVVLVDKDTKAYRKVMGAYKLPKITSEEQRIRSEEIQKALTRAAELPLKVCGCCLKVIDLCDAVISHGNPNAASDAGVAVLMAGAGAGGAALNVQTNLGGIKNVDKKQEITAELDNIMSEIENKERQLLDRSRKKIRNS